MIKHPLVIGVKQLRERDRGTHTVAQILEDLGQNTGNMMFTQALSSVVADAKLGSFQVSEEDRQGRDAIIIASANWINEYSDFQWLYDALKDIDLPIFLVGVGAQSSLSKEIPQIKPGTLSLLKLVAERSKSIATRGEFSSDVLSHYGIHNSVPTGCPSLLLMGSGTPDIPLQDRVANEGVSLHATRHLFGTADEFQTYLYRQALLQDLDLILQSEFADIYFALKRTQNEEILHRASETVTKVYGVASVDLLSKYLARRGKVFFTFLEWIEYMRQKQFCLGTRIHGTIASLIAGTQATLIVHDSRTLEMAEAMQIPFVRSTSIDQGKSLDISSFCLPERTKRFVEFYPNYYERYLRFFADNGIRVTHQSATSKPPRSSL